jgi:hypothetical protein
MTSRINHYKAKLVSKQMETSTFQVCYMKTTTEDLVVKELSGTICGIGNESDKENYDILGHNVQLSPIPIFSRICSVTVDKTGTMLCSCKYFERIGLPCDHLACVATLCHEMPGFDSHCSKFAGFTHNDIAVRWWSSYMYYAYLTSTPSHIVQKYHLLAMNSIKGPKMRCNVPMFLEIYDPKDFLPAIDCLKNYPRNSICLSQLKDLVQSTRRIHISLTNDEEIENKVISYVNNKWKDTSGGHLNDIFSQLIMNSDFYSPQKDTAVQARYSLKQL